ncbi:MAG: protein-export chaperone SecB [Alphaproteobacteria bacterium]
MSKQKKPGKGTEKPSQLPANDESMSDFSKSSLFVETQFIKDLSFENPNAPEIFALSQTPPKVSVNVDVKADNIEENRYEVEILLRAKAEHGDKVAFFIDLIYAGVFRVEGVAKNQLPPVLLVECPRLLFPFARRIIADVSRDGGFPRLLMQPIDFAEMYARAAAVKNEEEKNKK